MKWYSVKKETGETAYWTTQRDGNGVYYKIVPCGKGFRLYIDGRLDQYADYSSLSRAQAIAKKMWEPKIRYQFAFLNGVVDGVDNWFQLWFDHYEYAVGEREKMLASGITVTDIVEMEVA